MRVVILHLVVREGLTEKTFEQRPDGQEGTSQEQTWKKRVRGRGQRKYKRPELGTHLICLRNSKIKNNAVNYSWMREVFYLQGLMGEMTLSM